eukprot:Gregarina_sp_Poly_1__5955@NODE_3138_length_1346_cov_17_024238_g1995_i0_p2_GENE_NODE_3138_length_1346_cov_17_024238_g1995_i0NODE_3138_length_1346_cov_17_024238_g1995_i0_p2_ORF_typecomplete_len142_score4_06_NODE_3138_length_1346_cov_17_024238_g1995_i0396821
MFSGAFLPCLEFLILGGVQWLFLPSNPRTLMAEPPLGSNGSSHWTLHTLLDVTTGSLVTIGTIPARGSTRLRIRLWSTAAKYCPVLSHCSIQGLLFSPPDSVDSPFSRSQILTPPSTVVEAITCSATGFQFRETIFLSLFS